MRKDQGKTKFFIIAFLLTSACMCSPFGRKPETPPLLDKVSDVTEKAPSTESPQERIETEQPGKSTEQVKLSSSLGKSNGRLAQILINDEPLTGISDLWTAPDGRLWVATSNGIFINDTQGWVQALTGTPIFKVLGVGSSGEVWVLPDDHEKIYSYLAGQWKTYGPAQGWLPLLPSQYLSPGIVNDLAVSGDGKVWLATGLDEIRTYNPGTDTWKSSSAAQIGLPAYNEKDYQGYFLTDIVGTESGGVMVGACIGEGELLAGRGIADFSDGKWQTISSVQTACVMDIEVLSTGEIYVGDFNRLNIYDPLTETWTSDEFPPYERSQLVEQINIDPQGQVWIVVRRMGGASSNGGTAVYIKQQNNEWILVFETSMSSASDFAVSPNGAIYLSIDGVVFLWKNPELIELGSLEGLYGARLAVDGASTTWVGMPGGKDQGLWKVLP